MKLKKKKKEGEYVDMPIIIKDNSALDITKIVGHTSFPK